MMCAHYFNPFTRRMDFVMYEYRKDEHQRCFRKAGNRKKKKKQTKTKQQQPKRKEKDEYINLRVLC